MLKSRYKAFEIRDDDVSQTLVDGNLPAVADFIRNCDEGSIITIHTLEGEPFLIGLSKLFLYCMMWKRFRSLPFILPTIIIL